VNRTVLGIVERDGAFAEYLALPFENLHPVPDSVEDEQAVFCEPLAAALQIQEQLNVKPSQRVAVVGDGKLGNLVAQTLVLTGCELTVVGRHKEKLQLLQHHRIETVLDGDAALSGFDLVVECTGNPEGFKTAVESVRPRGTVVMKSTYHGELCFDAAPVVVNELTLVGSRCGPFEPALHLLESGEVDVMPLIDGSFGLSEAPAAFERAREAGVMKVLLTI
jgi:threonine dehydrogenase-like Zn-dependent dehydrogenase